MKPIIPLAQIVIWQCQHGTERRAYVHPQANCAQCGGSACVWKVKEA